MTIIYNEYRDTWNLFDGAEWIFEGTYEQCENMMYNSIFCDDEEDYDYDYEEDYDYGD